MNKDDQARLHKDPEWLTEEQARAELGGSFDQAIEDGSLHPINWPTDAPVGKAYHAPSVQMIKPSYTR